MEPSGIIPQYAMATVTTGDHDTSRHGPSLAPQVRSGTKLFNVLAELARGRSLNRFEAERDLHDHVLPSTIQKIERLGIEVVHRPEIVPGFAGSRVQTVRYSLVSDEREKAAVLLGWKIWRAT